MTAKEGRLELPVTGVVPISGKELSPPVTLALPEQMPHLISVADLKT